MHDGIPFGWDTVKLICRYVHSIGKVDETKLCDNAVHPTGRTAMNVGYMKAIFDPKTTVVGNLGDAASNITGMLKLTRLKSQMGMYERNPSTKDVCSIHPHMLNGSQISTYTCSVHVAKRTRTQLYLS